MLRFIGGLVLVVGIVFGIGLAMGWWEVSAQVNSDEIRKDVNDVGRTAKNVVRDITSDSMVGTVAHLDAPVRRIRVAHPDGGELEFTVDADAEIEIGGSKATLADLRVGDPVTVHYEKESAGNRAEAITAERKR